MNPTNRREPLSERPIDGRGIPHTGRLDYNTATAHLNNVTSTLSNPQANHGFVSSVLNSHVRPEFHTGQVPANRNIRPQTTQSGQQYQRLRVDDALWYLDQVKLQFGDQPHVYNNFLDIMKEFKSQSIDTPGVIGRVSKLFRGRPELISGFNTFLPPGYKIEVQSSGAGNNNQAFNVTLNISSSGGANGSANRVSTYHIISDRQTVATPLTTASQPNISSSSSNIIPKSEAVPTTTTLLPGVTLSQPPISLHPAQSQHIPNPEPITAQVVPQNVAPKQQQGGNNGLTAIQPGFNQAINYVNKIKTRFNTEPEVYKTFMEILHNFQKEQNNVKDGNTSAAMCIENEVFDKVRNLFKDEEDLLKDFSQFLPEAHQVTAHLQQERNKELQAMQERREAKPNIHNMVSAKDDEKVVVHSEHNFFERVRKAVKSQEVYDNFLRCIVLYNEEIINTNDLVQLVVHFIGKFPDLFAWFKNYVGYKDAIPTDQGRRNRVGDLEINYASCKRYGASYRAHPPNYVPPKCMGRTELCKQVLNDTWRSYPCWSEDSTFSGTKKTQYEEYINKCDDDRFELDVVIETNLACIKQLEAVQKKMSKLTAEELARFRLDNKLGGTSEVHGRLAIKRIYGDKHAGIVDGLKKSPQAVIPIVLKRLKSKDEEWCEARRQFNKIWNEQCQKYHLKSLDHQSATFKQTDLKQIRLKNLITEIETLYDERMEQTNEQNKGTIMGPHLTLVQKEHHIIEDAKALIIHHLRRQSHLQKDEKTKVKLFLNGFLQDFFFAPRGDVSEDESEEYSSEDDDTRSRSSRASNKGPTPGVSVPAAGPRRSNRKSDRPSKSAKIAPLDLDAADAYNLFLGNGQWYVFLRQHQLLCERLFTIYTYHTAVVEQEQKDRKNRKEPTAQAIKMRQPNNIPVEHFYTHFLSLVKDLLDCNIEQGIFEDKLREMFGVNSYIAFTLDKLINHIVRQSYVLATDAACNQMKALYLKHRGSGGAGGSLSTQQTRSPIEESYHKEVEKTFSEDNLYRIFFYKQGSKLTIELLDGEGQDDTEVEDGTKIKEEEVNQEKMDTS